MDYEVGFVSEHSKYEQQLNMDLLALTALCDKVKNEGSTVITYDDYYQACLGKNIDYDESQIADICMAAVRR